jgi:hypothetical protein
VPEQQARMEVRDKMFNRLWEPDHSVGSSDVPVFMRSGREIGIDSVDAGSGTAGADDGPATRLRIAYAAFAGGDMAPLGDLLAPDVVGHEHGRGNEPRAHDGRDAVLRRLADVAVAHWESVNISLDSLVSTPAWLAAVATWQATSRYTGHTYAVQHVLVARHDSRGLLAEVWLIYEHPRSDLDRRH